jgi:LysM repeat protein
MAVELNRDVLKVDQKIGEEQTQILVEGDILVPDVKPDISRILSVEGIVDITDKQAVQDKIIVDGVVNFKILYTSEVGEYPIYSMDASAGFNQALDIPGTTSEMNIHTVAEIEHIDFNIINERKIAIKTVVNLLGESINASSIEILQEINGIKDIQVLRDHVYYNDFIGSNQSETTVRESFEIDENMTEIDEILKCDALAVKKEIQVTDGKVIVNGVVKINVLYIGDDDRSTLYECRHEVPFTHFVEVLGAMKDMTCSATLKTDEIYAEAKEDIDGDKRIIEAEAKVKIEVAVNQVEEMKVLVDVYSPSVILDIEKQEVVLNQSVGSNLSNAVIKETIEIPSGNPDIFKVFNVHARPVVTDHSLTQDKSIIEGIIEANILYLAQDKNQTIHSFAQEIPFRHYVEIEGAREEMDASVDLCINDIDYDLINTEQIELKVNVGASCTVAKQLQVDVLVNVEESDEVFDISKRPSITIYYVQPGDTLWKIAKRYHTTVKSLIETNDIQNPDMIMPGDNIIIQKIYQYQF